MALNIEKLKAPLMTGVLHQDEIYDLDSKRDSSNPLDPSESDI